MRLLFLPLVVLPLLLTARENPFTPVEITKIDEAAKEVVVEPQAAASVSEVVIEKIEEKKTVQHKPVVHSKEKIGKQECVKP